MMASIHTQAQIIKDITNEVTSVVGTTARTLQREVKKMNAIDTAYIEPQHFNLAFMLEHSTWYEHYTLKGSDAARHYTLTFAPTLRTKLGVYFGWRWLFAGISFDVDDLFGTHRSNSRKTEFDFSIYSSRFGIDIFYRKTGDDFKIRSASGFRLRQPVQGTEFDGIRSNIYGLNAYWIFNYRHFSYPAAFSQSTCQRRSVGSFMAGFSYSHHAIDFDVTRLPSGIVSQMPSGMMFRQAKYADYSLTAGYGYNYVIRKNLLVNLSLMPGIGFKKSRLDDADNTFPGWIRDLNFDLVTRAGIVWNDTKYFAGASVVLHTYDYRKSAFSISNSFGVLRIYAGFNFLKRKPYRSSSSIGSASIVPHASRACNTD